MFTMQTKPRINSAAGGNKKMMEKRKNISPVYGDGVIQRVKFQYHGGKWKAIDDLDRGPREVPANIPTEEYGIYDTVTRQYTPPEQAHKEAFGILSSARQHQQKRSAIARDTGIQLPPRNRSEMYSTTVMKKEAIVVETPFGKSNMKAGFYKEKGGSRKQPLATTSGVPNSYGQQARMIDQMPMEKRQRVFKTLGTWASGTEQVEAPRDLLDSMSDQEKAVSSQVAVSVGVVESHDTRANPDGGKLSRASFRMIEQYPAREVLDPKSGANIMARKGGNKMTRELFSREEPHTPPRQRSLAPIRPFLSPVSPSPQRPVVPDKREEDDLTTEKRQRWRSAAVKIEDYMVNYATPLEREYFEEQIGFDTIRRWIVDPSQMTKEGIGKMMQFL